MKEDNSLLKERISLSKREDVFYSRRIGGVPVNYSKADESLDSNEVVISNPASTRLLNATKFSGRTKKGTGIGVFNAVTAPMHATLQDTISGKDRYVMTGPVSNYNVFVVDQNLKNNSSVSLTNTNVWRDGSTYDANVTTGIVDMYTKGQGYNIWAVGNLSQIISSPEVELGHRLFTGVRKSAGNFLWFAAYDELSNTYDPNDLGFNQVTNLRTFSASVSYNIYKPFWRLYRMWSNVNVYHSRRIQPNRYSALSSYANVGGTFRNFMTAGGGIYIEPTRMHDYFEPRIDGRFYESDALIAPDFFISSDYSKPFALDVNGTWYQYFEHERYGFDLGISPRIRFNDKWFLVYDYNQNNAWNEEGVALTAEFEIPTEGNDPIFAKRHRTTITNTINLSYIFNNRMGLTFRLRHYWSKLQYNSFYLLNEDGKMLPTAYTGLGAENESLHNNSFNAFTIDMVYRWVFAPGSELSLVWKNSIFSFTDEVENNYFQNLGGMFQIPAANSISLKVLYYIDCWTVSQKFKKKKR